jgi:dipeptidyl aminopeptidase/acylaminoacyl peptidase
MRPAFLLVALLLLVPFRAAELIPVEQFTRSADFSRARLSPDGRYIASIQEVNNHPWLVIFDLETKKSARINPGTTRSGLVKEVGSFRWISNKRISFVTTVFDGTGFTGVTAVDCDGQRWVPFAGYDADPNDPTPLVSREIIHSFADDNQSVLMIDRGVMGDDSSPDVVRVSTLTRSVRTVVKNPGNVISWVTDRSGVVRLGITRDGMRFGVIYRETEEAKWRAIPMKDEKYGTITPLGFDADGRRLLVLGDNAEKRRAVYYFDPEEAKVGDVVASHPQFDIIPERGSPSVDGVSLAGPVSSELAEGVIGIRYITDGPRMLWFDPGFAELQKTLDRLLPDTVNLIISRSQDERRFLVMAFSDRNPGQYFLVDLKGEKPMLGRLADRMTNYPVAAMVPMFPVQYPARDGETIHGYLTLPAGERRSGLPMIIMPHGGPFVRDIWQCNPLVQFLANRGYAVLQMNFRGSPGYGTEFYNKGKKEIGRGMQDDIEDGTRWAIAKGFADPARVAIVGASYGGYAALFALGHNPELYRCGVSMAGVTDWSDIIKERKGEEYRYAYQHFREWIGDPKLEFLAEASPVNFAAKITAPVFIVQGKEDRTVPPKQARKMIDALKKAGRPPQELFVGGEGHGFREEKNRAKLYTEIEKFLAANMAPK